MQHASCSALAEKNAMDSSSSPTPCCTQLANQHGLKRVAFPAISCGVFGYPLGEAAEVRACCRGAAWLRAAASEWMPACLSQLSPACFRPREAILHLLTAPLALAAGGERGHANSVPDTRLLARPPTSLCNRLRYGWHWQRQVV